MEKKQLHNIIKNIQKLQNSYVTCKDRRDALGMIKSMWQIGDYLSKNNIKKHHSLGWDIEKEHAFVSRPLIYRSFTIRRIWNNIKNLEHDLYGIKSMASVIEFIPFLDQNHKWNVPKNEIKRLLNIMNTKSSKQFSYELKEVKKKYIGITNNRDKHLKNFDILREIFYEFYNKINNLIRTSSYSDCKRFVGDIGVKNLHDMANLCLDIATKKGINKNRYDFEKLNNKKLYVLITELIKSTENIQKANRVRRVIRPLDFIKLTNICNSIVTKKNIEEFRNREGLNLPKEHNL